MIDLDKLIEEMNEGTWALSKSLGKRQEEGALCIKKIEELKDFVYPIFGDDLLFDKFDGAIRRIEELMAIPEEEISESVKNTDLVKKWWDRLNFDEKMNIGSLAIKHGRMTANSRWNTDVKYDDLLTSQKKTLVYMFNHVNDYTNESLNEDVVIPAELSQQYLVVKKQIADKQTQKDLMMRQMNQKENEINILNKNLIAIEVKAAQMQGKDAQVKTGETAKAENKTTTTPETPKTNESKISDLFNELNEMDQDWILEWGAEEFEEEGEGETGEVADVLEPEEEASDEDLNSDYVFAIKVKDEDEDEDIIAKIYRNEEDTFWKIRVVQGSEEPLETMQFDPDMEFLDIMEKIGEIYDEVEEISMEKYKELLDDKADNDAKYKWEEEPVEEQR